MSNLLAENQLMLLFLVAAIGYLIGNVSIKGNKLGLAAVLFVGLAFGAINPSFQVEDIIFELGLVLFVYSIGLSSGPAFFKSFKKNGYRDFAFILLMLSLSAILAVLVFVIFKFSSAIVVGLYSGSTTNTPALAGVIDLIGNSKIEDLSKDSLIQQMVVGYTFSYPMGVIGVMISIILVERILKIDYKKETNDLKKHYQIGQKIDSKAIRITHEDVAGRTMRDLYGEYSWNVIFGRYKKADGRTFLPNWDTPFKLGDEVMVVAEEEELNKIEAQIGEFLDDTITNDRSVYDVRRIFVSNNKLVGKEIKSLNIQQKFNAVITRVRRGDMEMLADPDLILEQGDRIRFVARKKDLVKLSKYFGDSYYHVSTVNIFSFGIGIALGLMLGMIEFTLPGGVSLKLGYAGGPLIVGLFLGFIRRTGNLVWTMPYGVNVTLRQLGLTMLLAVIGLRSGNTFIDFFSSGSALWIFLGGTIISIGTAILSLVIGYKLFKIPFSLLLGFVSNQPAILDFVNNKAKNNIPVVGYTMMFPIAMILKIIYAQLLYLCLS